MVPLDDSPSTVPPPVPDAGPAEERYFRSGLGLRQEVRGEVEADYHSDLVRQFRENGYTLEREGVTFRLAREFGFCYGVERAVDYAYETVRRFPDRRIVLTGEIIHNPKVNDRLRELGIRFLGDEDVPDVSRPRPRRRRGAPRLRRARRPLRGAPGERRRARRHDVRLRPQRLEERRALRPGGAHLDRPREGQPRGDARHGQPGPAGGGRALPRGPRPGGGPPGGRHAARRARRPRPGRSSWRASPAGRRRGSTRTSTSSASAWPTRRPCSPTSRWPSRGIVRDAIEARYGPAEAADRFRSFDTICSATQERQDALKALIEEPLDLVLVIGGYNSSNTAHLLELAEPKVRAFHVRGPRVPAREGPHPPQARDGTRPRARTGSRAAGCPRARCGSG